MKQKKDRNYKSILGMALILAVSVFLQYVTTLQILRDLQSLLLPAIMVYLTALAFVSIPFYGAN